MKPLLLGFSLLDVIDEVAERVEQSFDVLERKEVENLMKETFESGKMIMTFAGGGEFR